MDGFQFYCECCGQTHNGLPALAYERPHYYISLSDEERAAAKANDDLCETADGFYFVRAVFKIAIHDEELPLEYGVWGSLSEKSFALYKDTFDDADQSKIGGFFSYFGNRLERYPDTVNLHCDLYTQDNRQRPVLVLHTDQDHPLVRDQINGITKERAVELAMPFRHPHGSA